MARLIFQLGDGKTVDFILSSAVVTLGRSTSNDIVINNGWISSHHAKFERSGGSIAVTSLGTLHGIPLKEYKRVGGVYTVIDLDSHNGVTVNGMRISSQELKSGDVVAFGQLEARFEDAPTPPADTPETTKPVPATASAGAADPPVAPDIPLFVTPSRPRPITQPLVKPAIPPPLPASPPPLPATPALERPPMATPPAEAPTAATPLAAAPAPEAARAEAPPAPTPPIPAFPTAEPPPPAAAPLAAAPAPEAVPAEAPPAPTPQVPAPPVAEPPPPVSPAPTAEVAAPPPQRPVAPAADSPPLSVEPVLPPVTAEAVAAPPPSPMALDAQPATPKTAKTALASIQRDVALLEKTLGALQDGAAPGAEADQALARGLIQRIDLLEDLMTSGERTLPGLADRLAPLHASLLELLREHSIEPYTVQLGHALDVATRKRITIVEPAPEGEGITEIAEVFRPGYHFTRGSGDLPAVILRKAEVRTLRRSLGQVT